MTYPLRALLTGQVKPLGRRGAPSGIAKSPVAGPIMLGLTGFEGDAQGDTKHHGGPEKAVHHYPFDHYATWTAEIGTHARLAEPGAFGENLSTLGLTEDVVAIGDVFSSAAPFWKSARAGSRAGNSTSGSTFPTWPAGSRPAAGPAGTIACCSPALSGPPTGSNALAAPTPHGPCAASGIASMSTD